MPYISQEQKKEIQNNLSPVLQKYQVKASLGIYHHSTLVLNIYSSPIDFIGNYNKNASEKYCNDSGFQPARDKIDINPYWYHEHFDGEALEFLTLAMSILNGRNGVEVEDGDYGTVPNYYVDINIGKWDKPYSLVA